MIWLHKDELHHDHGTNSFGNTAKIMFNLVVIFQLFQLMKKTPVVMDTLKFYLNLKEIEVCKKT